MQDWLELMLERDLSGVAEAGPATTGDPVLVLPRPDFDAAVRQALRRVRHMPMYAAPDELAALLSSVARD